ncbi:MAG TPA: hypothetical protein VKX17_06820 [Planctomycetota bacterium]|nr:hypothetical protein [Planctomycetota bacterium]
MSSFRAPFIIALLASIAFRAHASDLDEFKIKRQEIFEFTQKPSIARNGDRVEISFAAKGFCDATIAIETGGAGAGNAGKIIRHLVSGVLGPNAPAPFPKNALEQKIVWDSKDDHGNYIDDKDSLTVRVSLGLKPEFERVLYYSPKKRIGEAAPLIQADADGVYVFDTRGIDHLRAFDRDGNYLRTVYPFPADNLPKVEGLDWYDFPQGLHLPLKKSLYQQTLLTSGDNCSNDDKLGMDGTAASALATRNGRIAIAKLRLNRLQTDGTTGGKPLNGPRTCLPFKNFRIRDGSVPGVNVTPTSAAISPDGKWLYLAGYSWRYPYNFNCMHGVMRMALDGDEEPQVFAGNMGLEEEKAPIPCGSDNAHFKCATSVDCDSRGRVYVSDYMNDRIQVFSPDGKFLQSIPAIKPALVRLHRKTNDIYVFSWVFCNKLLESSKPPLEIQPALTHFGPLENPRLIARYDLPLPPFKGRYGTYIGVEHALVYSAEIDSWSEPLTIWLGQESRHNIERGVHPGDGGVAMPWEKSGIRLLREKNGKLEVIRDFGSDTVAEATRARPPTNSLQRLEVNPTNGMLYVGEADSGPTGKSSKQLLKIDPETGKIEIVDVPFNAMEFTFDINGLIYMRSTDVVARYDPNTWREVPWDYGESLPAVGDTINGKYAPTISGLVLPAKSPVCFHQGGMYVSPNGHLVVSCAHRYSEPSQKSWQNEKPIFYSRPYAPKMYPGRIVSSTSACIHVWDKYGKLFYEDYVPGVGQVDGVALDRDDNLYSMETASRMLDGKKYFNDMSSTLIKFKPPGAAGTGGGKVTCSSQNAPIPLPADARPNGNPAVYNGTLGSAWVEGAEWFYGGVGFAGFNASRAGGGCACWFSRFTLDYFARSFAPEPYQFNVAVLDTAGNLIVRVGKYGNEDSAGAKSLVPLGGDEVGLFHACFVGTHTDRRLFISDVGNGRILSVRLNYHSTESVPLKSVPDAARKR